MLKAPLPSVTYRNYITTVASNAMAADDHCTILRARVESSRLKTEFPIPFSGSDLTWSPRGPMLASKSGNHPTVYLSSFMKIALKFAAK
jgi:hypothetical protein